VSVTNYITFIFFVILYITCIYDTFIILPLYWIALDMILNLFTYTDCN